MTISPALNGFIKQLVLVVLMAIVAFVADPAHLTFLSAGVSAVVASLASSLESYIKAQSGQGLFGAVNVSR